MAANTALQVTSLDFDTIKASLKQYLKNQSVFTDYDFESSNMNVLLSVLAYNSYMNSFYLNMVASEAFLDTAQMRNSVVSHAKLLNYTPNSYTSPKATVSIDITSNQTYDTFIIPKGTQFSGSNANNKFTFVTDKVYTASATSTSFTIDDIDLYEGTYVTDSFVTNSTIENQRFAISNPNCDTSSLTVTVYENNGSDVLAYTQATTFDGVTDESQVFFVQAYENGFEIVFGDDVFGRKPQDGAVVSALYRVTNGADGNGIERFTLDQDLGAINGGSVSVDITTVDASTNGAVSESIESIRYRAPRYFSTQGRAITTDDYKTLILNTFSDIKSVAVYGGETITGSVQYGSIILSPLTYSGTALSTPRKQDLKDFISQKMTLGLVPEVIDPDFLYLFMNIDVLYNANRTNKSPSVLETNIISAITDYNTNYLQDFAIAFRQSKFLQLMQQVDASIISVRPEIYMQKTVTPELRKSVAVTYKFNNAIVPGTIQSTPFQSATDGLSYTLTDYNPNNDTFVKGTDGFTIKNTANYLYLSLFDPASQGYTRIGTIDYETGTIAIAELSINSFLEDAGIILTCQPASQDISGMNNDLVEIDLQQTTITVTANR
jgi:hypothetical protein